VIGGAIAGTDNAPDAFEDGTILAPGRQCMCEALVLRRLRWRHLALRFAASKEYREDQYECSLHPLSQLPNVSFHRPKPAAGLGTVIASMALFGSFLSFDERQFLSFQISRLGLAPLNMVLLIRTPECLVGTAA
jgi:hypothetical protein